MYYTCVCVHAYTCIYRVYATYMRKHTETAREREREKERERESESQLRNAITICLRSSSHLEATTLFAHAPVLQ